MEISVFTCGPKTLLGKRTESLVEIISFDSRMIFQDPDLVFERLLKILEKKFSINDPKSISKMIFGISGVLNPEKGVIMYSHILNQITMIKEYGGFSFKDCFGGLIGRDNVCVVNDAFAVASGFKLLYPVKALPSIIIMLEIGVGVSLITSDGEVIATELGSDPVPVYNKTSHQLLDGDGINRLLLSGSRDISGDYSKLLIDVALFYKNVTGETIHNPNSPLNFYILTSREEFLDKELLYNNQREINFIFPQSEDEKSKIPILGLFSSLGYKGYLRTIKRIDYYSSGEKIYEFCRYKDFIEHWNDVKEFANPDNQYKVIYSDGVIKPVKMRDLNHDFELEAYKF